AVKLALLYGLLGHIFAYSATLLRDIHVSFLFALGIYILFCRKSFIGIFFLLLIDYLIFGFRPEHGIFFLSFLGYYSFRFLKNNRKKALKFLPVILILIGAVLYFYINNLLDSYVSTLADTTSKYSAFAEET